MLISVVVVGRHSLNPEEENTNQLAHFSQKRIHRIARRKRYLGMHKRPETIHSGIHGLIT